MIKSKFKNLERISEKESAMIIGGDYRRMVIRDSDNVYGLIEGIYIVDTENGEVWNVLGESKGSWCEFVDYPGGILGE